MLYVALGRNVGDAPMDDVTWSMFVADVVETVRLSERVGQPDTRAFGTSSFEGVEEETCVLVWFDKNTIHQGTEDALGGMAKFYGQKSIAYSLSKTFFTEGVDN